MDKVHQILQILVNENTRISHYEYRRPSPIKFMVTTVTVENASVRGAMWLDKIAATAAWSALPDPCSKCRNSEDDEYSSDVGEDGCDDEFACFNENSFPFKIRTRTDCTDELCSGVHTYPVCPFAVRKTWVVAYKGRGVHLDSLASYHQDEVDCNVHYAQEWPHRGSRYYDPPPYRSRFSKKMRHTACFP